MDPRKLSFSEKFFILKRNFTFIFGLIFGLIPAIFLASQIIDIGRGSIPFIMGNEYVESTIVGSNDTYVDICKSSHSCSGISIYKVHYQYSLNNQQYKGTSYCEQGNFDDSTTLTVRYSTLKPSLSYATDCSIALTGPLNWVFLVFLITGLICVKNGWKTVKTQIYLIEKGTTAEGEIVDIIPNGSGIRTRKRKEDAVFIEIGSDTCKRSEYTVFFEFTSLDGSKIKSSQDTMFPELVQENRLYLVLYEINEPQKAILYDLVSMEK